MDRSAELYSRSSKVSPGGVSSPVRAFKPNPIYIAKGQGSRVWDADGKEYIDLCMAYGPLITGHACPRVMDAAKEQIFKGTVYGAPSEPELNLIERIVKEVPSAEMVRLGCSGTEATMHAIRVARGVTGRDDIIKMNGGFHGAHDAALVAAGSGSAGGVPSSKGVLSDVAKHTFTAEYNDIQSMSDILDKNDIACVIMEPILGNVGIVTPEKGYLEEVRKVTKEHDTVLIFDEVIMGFRASSGGAQKRYGVTPDMTTMGKIVGGGFAAGAFMGRKDIMENVAPQGQVYVAGTFAGNPVSAAAGLAAIDLMCSNDNYAKLEKRTDCLVKSIRDSMADNKITGCVNSVASMFSIFFGIEKATNGTEAMKADRQMFDRMFRYMLANGVYLPPSALEVDFMSLAHSKEDVAELEEKFKGFFESVKQ
ncbi:MAG: glutamate-1-semialdehyde 2,1-aminomutase [Candidatus Methanomethylophilaceae archaeon]|nr:glutamate-1-semialdehyde 2,1-aminomutase [Candidatus Methanomethylophilaceae archaeon]